METEFIAAVRETRWAVTFYFKKPPNFTYIAGQFVDVQLPHVPADSRGSRRWFTLSSSPTEPNLSITTNIYSSPSTFKYALMKLRQGDSVKISEPMGDFILPRKTSKPLLFVAGGIGVTPYRSMVQYLIDTAETRDITMIYAAKDKATFAFTDTFDKTTTLHRVIGTLEPSLVKKHAALLDNPLVYVSGPEQFVELLYDELKNDFGQTQLLRDYFPNYTY